LNTDLLTPDKTGKDRVHEFKRWKGLILINKRI